MSNKLKLKTIKLETADGKTVELETADGKTVELSLAEAKDLHDQLHELFGTKYVPSVPIVIERDRYPWPYAPRWLETPQPTNPLFPIVYCSTQHDSGLNVTMCGDAA